MRSLLPLLAITAVSLAACDKSSGSGQQTAGRIESAVGNVTGDQDLKQQGQKDQVVGGVKSAVGDLKDAAKAAVK